MNKFALPVLFLTAFPCLLFGVAEHVICVDSDSGHDKATCLQSSCQTLEYVHSLLKSVANESVVIEICGPQINLTRALDFTNFTNLSITGDRNKTKIVCNTSYSGLSFINITGLSLNYIQLINCGAKQNSTMYDPSTNKMIIELSAVFLLNCRDVNITNCVIYRSDGTGISMLNTNGNVCIEHTDIIESSLRSSSSDIMMFGGSGLHIEFNYCTNGNTAYSYNNCTHSEHYSYATYTIYRCSFIENRADNSSTLAFFNDIGPMSCGGGVYIGFAVRASYLDITLENCTIQYNSAAEYGGGIKLQIYETAQDNQILLLGTTLSNNNVPNNRMGGGLEIAFLPFRHQKEYNSITVISCDFTSNFAGMGGGLNIFSHELPFKNDLSAITFTDCTWTNNTALYGAAVQIVPETWESRSRGRNQLISFINCSITQNVVIDLPQADSTEKLQVQRNGAGAFFSIHVAVLFCGVTTFEGNNGTALYLSGSVAIFNASSQVTFSNNSGMNGGAVSLMGRSYFLLNGSSDFTFANNRARQLGGGLYFKSSDDNSRQPCFIYRDQYTKRSRFNFSGNYASTGRGHHIFASSFTSCNIYCPGTHKTIYDCIGTFEFNPDNDTIATLPTHYGLDHADPIAIIPGFSYYLPLKAKDVMGNYVSNISYEASLEHKSSNSSMKVDSAFKYVSNNTIRLSGNQRDTATLRLDTLSTDISLLVNITLVECPPGYVLDPSDLTCKCRASTYYGLQKCDPEAYIMYGVWMGHCNHSALCTAGCPVGYCSYNSWSSLFGLYRPLPLNTSNLEAFICSPTRTGTLCGQCRDGHSVYFNSWDFQCGKENYCHLGPLFLILSTIVPLTTVFIVITLLDTNFAGNWNGFIFFCQMVTYLYIYANGTIRFSRAQFQILNWLMFTYSFFNLEIFNINQLSFCIWKGAGVMDILMIKLGTILFALVLVLFTVFILRQHKLTKCFPCLSRRRFSVINGISAFFILCYAQCAKTCFQVLASTCLNDENYKCIKNIIFYDGSMSSFQGEHIEYATMAVVMLIFIVILPPVLLLFYPLFFKILGLCGLSESKFATYLWKMMPIQLLDSFQNPFKDNCRFFAGLYFLYRTIAMVVYAIALGLGNYYAVIELEFGIIILFHSLFQPYKKVVFNVIDVLLFFNLILINGITLYNYFQYSFGASGAVEAPSFLTTLQIVLLFLPLVSAVIYLKVKLAIWIKCRYMSSGSTDGYKEIDSFNGSYSR